MARCKQCVHYEVDGEISHCRLLHLELDPFLLEAPDEMGCDYFERYQECEEWYWDSERYDDYEISLFD